jgi:hypothetical protein
MKLIAMGIDGARGVTFSYGEGLSVEIRAQLKLLQRK